MTCSRNFGRLLQAGCLGLIGTLTVVGCGGSESGPKLDGGGAETNTTGPTGAALTIDRATVNLGSIDVGTTGSGTVSVTNIGKAVSGNVTVTATGGITATGCGAALQPNQSCVVTITATPAAPGNITGTVTISANPGTGTTPLVVSVLGQVNAPGIFTVAPAAIDLGDVLVGAAPVKSNITVTAKVALTDLTVTSTGTDIAIDKATSTCTTALAANTPCTVVVTFSAAGPGARSNTVTIAGGGPTGKTASIPVTANAKNPAKLVISPSTTQAFQASVGSTSSVITFGVANSGDVATGTLAVAITGTNKDDFTATSNCLVLAPLAGCTVSVTFKPAAVSTTAETATLTVTDGGAGASTVSVPLTGTAILPSALVITPTAGDLGSALIGATGTATIFTVTNTGDTASGALALSLSSPEFTITNDTCTGASLAPKTGNCTVSIAVKPVSIGAKTATLTVTGTNGNPAVKTLNGAGITPASIGATPASLDFGSVRVNKTGTPQTVTVKNTGASNSGVLSFTKGGSFSVFPITANTCSAALGPGATCTFTVNFAPIDTGSFSATYTVTDGTTSTIVSVSGTGLPESGITIDPSGLVKDCPSVLPAAPIACFNQAVVGGVAVGPQTFIVTADQLPAGSGLTDTGALTVTLGGANAADFQIDKTLTDCGPALLPSNTCKIIVNFAPTVVGTLQATLTVTTANGGLATVTLQSRGLPLIELTKTDETALVTKDLDFGQVTLLGSDSTMHTYRVVVRGPNNSTTHTTSVLTTLTDPSQPADFLYSYGLTNPCNTVSNTAETLEFGNDLATPVVPVSVTPGNNNWGYIGGAVPQFFCEFSVTFAPQSGKGAKTATISATGSGGASDTKNLTGTSTGPLKFDPNVADFGNAALVGDSTNAQSTLVGVTLSGPDMTLTLINGSTNQSLGPVSLTLAGANADQFWIVADDCSTVTLAPGDVCFVSVAFAPTSVGAKTASLTANAGTETATATLMGGASTGFDITITPDQYDPTAQNVHDFGTVPQTGATASGWTAFTISNPAGSPRSAQVQFDVRNIDESSAFKLATDAPGTPIDATHHPYGTCGQTGTTTLQPGANCTLFVQFNPSASDPVTTTSPLQAIISATDIAKGAPVWVQAQGSVSSIITVAPTTFAFPETAEAVTSANSTFVITNKGTVSVSLTVPPATGPGAITPFNVVQGTGCALNTTLAAGQSCNLLVNFVGVQGGAALPDPVSKVTAVIGATPGGASAASIDLSGKTVSPALLVAEGLDNGADDFSYHVNLGGVRITAPGVSDRMTLRFKNIGSQPTDSLHYQWSTQSTPDTADGEFIILNETTTGCVGKTSLAAGAECTVTVYFQPNAAKPTGTRTATFALSATSQGGAVRLFTFDAYSLATATGWVGIAGGANANYTFPGTTASGLSAASQPKQVFTITNNTGTSRALGLSVTAGGPDFSIVVTGADAGSNPCLDTGATLANSASCTFGVVFDPNPYTDTTVYRFGTVSAGDNFVGTWLGLMGRVQSPAKLTISPSADQELGQVLIGKTVVTPFTLTNAGESASDALALSITGPAASHYSVTAGTCAGTMAAGATCSGTVTFAAGTTPGSAPGDVLDATLNASVAGSAVALDFSAWAVAPTILGMQQSAGGAPMGTMAFGTATSGQTPVGTSSSVMSVWVGNAANAMTTGLLTLTLGDKVNFAIDTTNCPLATNVPLPTSGLVGGGSCQVDIIFTPKTLPANATFTTTLTASEAGGSTPAVLAITGYAKSALSCGASPLNAVTNSTTSPKEIVCSLALGAPTTSYLKTSLTGTDFMVVWDDCLVTKLSSNQSCSVFVAFIGTAPTTNKTSTLTVNGGVAGNSASVVINSSTP